MTLLLNGTNGVSDVDGTAATPAIRGTDTNTGIFFPAADTIAFAEGGAEVARFDSSGNLGIGTSSPTQKLDVLGSSNTTIKIKTNAGVSGNYSQLLFDTHNSFSGVGQAYIRGVSLADGNSNTGITFGVNSSGFGAPFEAMRIDSSGNLLVGTTSAFGSGAAIQAFRGAGIDVAAFQTNTTSVQGIIRFYNPNGAVGNINTSGSSTAYATSSDYRLKENVAPMTGALGVVQQLKPVTYNWKVDGSSGQGFIAHELQEVVPDCVTGEKDAVETYTDEDGVEQTRPQYQGIDTSFLVATLTAAIQELNAKVDAQTLEIQALKGVA